MRKAILALFGALGLVLAVGAGTGSVGYLLLGDGLGDVAVGLCATLVGVAIAVFTLWLLLR